MKILNHIGFSIVTIGILTGCGSDNDTSSINTGTGYYVDSAVKGVDYTCGTQTGVTDEDGKFIFESGKDCSFSVAGVPLRTTQADALKDGVKVLEDNTETASFLQSIDNDGNASNGIQIDTEIITILTEALDENNITNRVPSVEELPQIVNRVKDDVPTFEGNVKTPEEVKNHLTATQTEITKELLAGKTFYDYIINENEPSIIELKIDAKAESWVYTFIVGGSGTNTAQLKIEGNQLTVTYDHGSKIMKVSQDNDKYLSVGSKTLFYNKSDVEALIIDATTSTLSDLIVGKTYYVTACDSYEENNKTIANNHVETLFFGTDGRLHNTWLENDTQQEVVMDYSISGETLTIITPDEGTLTFSNVTQTTDYMLFTTGGKLYTSKIVAESNLKDDCSVDSPTTIATSIPSILSDLELTTEYLNGKTFYYSVEDEEEQSIDYKSISFLNGIITSAKVNLSNNYGRESITEEYSIDDGKILKQDNNGTAVHIVLKKEGNDYLELREQSVSNPEDGKDFFCYFYKPSDYPTEL